MKQAHRITELPNNKHKPFGGAYSVHDQELVRYKNKIIVDFPNRINRHHHEDIKQEYLRVYPHWMNTYNNIRGLGSFTEACFSQGTTESFYQFYIRYRKRRLRLAHGEYFFHQMMSRLWFKDNFAWIGDDDIKKDDVVVLSVPFSDTGASPEYLDDLLRQCTRLNVPVMLDLAYVNLTTNFYLDLNHACIEYVVTSLSKVFPLELHRVGLRLQRKKFDDQLYVINEPNYDYINILSAYLGLRMMQHFDANYTYSKYHHKQRATCEKFNVMPSKCVYFGIDTKNLYSEYNRGNETNRLCFSRVWDGRMGEPDPIVLP